MNFYLAAILCFGLSLILTVAVMPLYIDLLKKKNISQEVSEYALEEYKQKAKTPIMGGLIFVVVPVIVYLTLNFRGFADKKALMVIVSYLLFCLVGFLDDYLIIIRKNNNGLSPRVKLIMEFIFTLAIYFIFRDVITNEIAIPFLNKSIKLGILFIPLMILIYLSEANAVNFTDGMDGLCAGVSFIALIAFVIISYKNGELNIALLILSIMGGLIGYLKYNHFPAKIFMGDSGSLALGALFASVAIVLHKEIALFFIGGVFVFEMFCVCLQLSSVKLFHKRVFRYTPIHYAFVLKGHKETRVVSMFYLLAFVVMLVGLFIGLH